MRSGIWGPCWALSTQDEMRSISVVEPPMLVKEGLWVLPTGKGRWNFCPYYYINQLGLRAVDGLRPTFSGMMSPMHLKDHMQFKLLPRNIYLRSSLVLRGISKVLGLLTVYGTRLFVSLPWTDAYSIGMLLCKLKEFPAIPNLDCFFRSWQDVTVPGKKFKGVIFSRY